MPRPHIHPDWGKQIIRRKDEDADWGDSKMVLRYPLQQAEVNVTDFPERKIRPGERAVDERLRGRLAKRDNNWNWKHLEDYRGFLYFIESAFSPGISHFSPFPSITIVRGRTPGSREEGN